MVEDETEREQLNEQWKVVHDLCSISALNVAFDECFDGESYDLGKFSCHVSSLYPELSLATDAIWQLIGLSSWFVQLLERIVKQCIYVGEGNPSFTSLNRDKTKPIDQEDMLQSPCGKSEYRCAKLHL